MKELSNWGRWGKADQAGTVNLITPDKRKAAAQLVREGFSVSLARNADKLKAVDNDSPWEHVMTGTGAKLADEQVAGDTYSVSYHGYGHSHGFPLPHILQRQNVQRLLPNGSHRQRANKLAVTNFKAGIFT